MKYLEKYNYCPICASVDFRPDVIGKLTKHPLYRKPLPETIQWMICRACGHNFTEGYWTKEALDIIFSSAHSNQIFQPKFVEIEQGRAVSSRILDRLVAQGARGTLLDVGFGNGSLLLTAQEYGFTVEGIDVREAAVEALCPYANVFNQSFHKYAQCEVQAEPRLDVIILADVLEHSPFPRIMISECYDMLKPGGFLFVSCPNTASASWPILGDSNPYWYEIEHHHNFSTNTLTTILDDHLLTPLTYNVSERYISCMEIIARKAPA